MKWNLFFLAVFFCGVASADVKLSQLPLGSGAIVGPNDSFPYVDFLTGITKRLKVLDIANISSLKKNIQVITANYTAISTDHYLISNSTTNINLTLPNISVIDSIEYELKNIGTGILNINPYSAAQSIDGNTSYSLNQQYQAVKLVSKGGVWFLW